MHEIRIAPFENLRMSVGKIATMKGFPTKMSVDPNKPFVPDFSRMEKYKTWFDYKTDEIIIQWWEKQNE